MVKNPKTRKAKFYHAATRDVFIPGIGPHLVVLVPCGSVVEAGDAIEEPAEEFEAPSKRRFRVFVTNRRDWDASTVLSMYSLRWTIETCFQDLSQHLGVHGCKWRDWTGNTALLPWHSFATCSLTGRGRGGYWTGTVPCWGHWDKRGRRSRITAKSNSALGSRISSKSVTTALRQTGYIHTRLVGVWKSN